MKSAARGLGTDNLYRRRRACLWPLGGGCRNNRIYRHGTPQNKVYYKHPILMISAIIQQIKVINMTLLRNFVHVRQNHLVRVFFVPQRYQKTAYLPEMEHCPWQIRRLNVYAAHQPVHTGGLQLGHTARPSFIACSTVSSRPLVWVPQILLAWYLMAPLYTLYTMVFLRISSSC